MKKEARHLLRLENRASYIPADQPALLARVRAIIEPLGGQAMNLRVTQRALEFDLFCPPAHPIGPFAEALAELGGLASHRPLDDTAPVAGAAQIVQEARDLFREHRYWEVHEVLEGLWKRSAGDEKRFIQGIILAAAALVHAQKNEPAVVRPMLEDALRRLKDAPSDYYGADLRGFRERLREAVSRREIGELFL